VPDRSFAYPIFLQLTEVPVLLVGGGRVALRKAEALLAADATLTVVAPQIDPALHAAARQCHVRPYRSGDIAGHRLVMIATDDPAVNAAVAADGIAAGVWVNSADDPANCTFILPAVAREGAVTVAVSTGGASPALASHLRAELQQWLADIGAAAAAERLSAQRDELHALGVSTESIDWSSRVIAALGKR
jgi:siroheme synthase-like protein